MDSRKMFAGRWVIRVLAEPPPAEHNPRP